MVNRKISTIKEKDTLWDDGWDLKGSGTMLDSKNSINPFTTSPLMNGSMPDSKGSIMLVFQMQKKWNVKIDTKMDLYYVFIRGEIVEKYKLPLNY